MLPRSSRFATEVERLHAGLDPRNVAVFTVRDIMEMRMPILIVNHDAEDGTWQFLTRRPLHMKDAMLVSLSEIVRLDPTVAVLADLPLGGQAHS